MATETLEGNKPKVKALAQEEDDVADSVKDTVSEKDDSRESDEADKEEKEEAKEGETEEKEEEDDSENKEEEAGKKGSGRKKSAEKEPVTPVSDRPTRERKKVERYSLPTPSRSSASKSVSIDKGRGTSLREIPNVAYKLSKRKPDDNLLLLHTILYGKKAKAQMLKKNLGQFSGFAWSEKEEEKQRARVKENLEKCIKEKLIDFCDVLDIPINKSNVKKEELSVKLLEFLEYPMATRELLLAEKKATKRKISPKIESSGEASEVAIKRKRRPKTSGKNRNQPSESEEGKDETDDDSEATNASHEEDDAPPKEQLDGKDTQIEDEKDEAGKKKSSEKKSSLKKSVKESSGAKCKDIAASAEDTPGKSSKSRKSRQVTKSTSSPTKKQKVEKEGQKDQNNSSKKQSI